MNVRRLGHDHVFDRQERRIIQGFFGNWDVDELRRALRPYMLSIKGPTANLIGNKGGTRCPRRRDHSVGSRSHTHIHSVQ